MELILWIIAVTLVLFGLSLVLRSRILPGVALIVVGLLVGPGGVSLVA